MGLFSGRVLSGKGGVLFSFQKKQQKGFGGFPSFWKKKKGMTPRPYLFNTHLLAQTGRKVQKWPHNAGSFRRGPEGGDFRRAPVPRTNQEGGGGPRSQNKGSIPKNFPNISRLETPKGFKSDGPGGLAFRGFKNVEGQIQESKI